MGVFAATEAELSTSTTRASSEPTTSETGSPSQNVANNPSLILAFLALSFFTLAMVFVFGFRRYQQMQQWNRSDLARQWQAEEEIRKRRLAENKPQLLEVRLDVANTRWRELSWENLMPLSASSLKNDDQIGIAADPVSSLSPPTLPHSMTSILRHIRDLRAFRALSPRTGDDNNNNNNPERETVQVVFPLAMPSKYRPIRVTETNGRRHSQCRELVDYEIAVYDSLWISTS